jgi:transcriptional regulator with PAS, ATPase and Fis domain
MEIQEIKQRYGIIGNSPLLNRAINIANQVAPTDISVLITGESGSGKEVFSHIIHQMSPRKHGPFIAVNCGAIPEGTIDSELFGHEKGAYTGAVGERKGYFETAVPYFWMKLPKCRWAPRRVYCVCLNRGNI